MCEWLSGGEWCDVQIQCGGRYFNAHRAVLASVSTFLRRILLSCPPDETTILIVLPDFDIEAMSSVLYYIYKGEVIVNRNKIELFLDIIQAMQIYVDCQYLCDIRKDVEKYFGLEKCCKSIAEDSEIFTLASSNNNDQNIYKVKKCEQSQRVLYKYSQNNSDFHDNSVRSQNESELGESRLGNLKLPYDGRQRNSLLRDLFIETYPQNGNVNGLVESVPAISNGCYLSPASVLLPNANCRHLSVDDAHALPNKATGHSLHSSAVGLQDGPQSAYSCREQYDRESICENPSSLHYKCSDLKEDSNLMYSKSRAFLEANRFIRLHNSQFVKEKASELHENNSINPSFHTDIFDLHSNGNTQNISTADLMVCTSLTPRYQTCKKKVSNSSTKAILNHVLESPWNARKPNNYRPFRRKEKQGVGSHTYKEDVNAGENDTNNNIEKPPPVQEEKVIVNREREVEEIIHSSPVENRESFKCTYCHQVFTSGESLAVHTRRHSGARYTCGECGKTFSQLRNFKYHMSVHRGTREFAATCTVCGKYFNDRGYLSSHMKIHRNRKEYKCSLCPKSFNQRVAYNMHVRIHTGVKPHVCEECGKPFSRKMLLKQHQRTHSGERPYACTHCDKRFADRSNMTLHLRLHTGVKPFSCPMCPKSFTKKHHLKSHLNFHTGSKPYSCPRCQLAFTQSSNMRTHYKKCTAPEPGTSNVHPVLEHADPLQEVHCPGARHQ